VTPADGSREHRKAALAGWIGSALEYYDFFLHGTAAALVFGRIFFPQSDPATGTLLALGTFGSGYVARPVGAVLLGHLGDRWGRRRVLVTTLLVMGSATFLVGCLPTYAQVGVLAPAALVALRVLQGLAASGEQAGANAMTLEHAPQGRRGYFASFTLSGTQAGQILATAVFLPVAALPDDQLLSWGWRVPFWVSAVVVVTGFAIRRTLRETPAFEDEPPARFPLVELVREHGAALVRVVAASLVCAVSTVFTVFTLSFAVHGAGLSRTPVLWVGVLANIVALAAIPAFARLSDGLGRKPVFLAGVVGSGLLISAYLAAIHTGSYPLVFATGILAFGVAYSAANGIWPAFYGEMFPTRVRLTGTALGTQVGFAVSGFVPSIAAALVGGRSDAWWAAALLVLALCAVSAIAACTARETHRTPLQDLDGRPAPAVQARGLSE
jgi:MFS family permease